MLTSTALGPAASAESAMGRVGFIGQHGLWTESQAAAANELTRRLEDVRTVRVAWADQHGLVRGKALPVDVFRSVLRNGMRANTGPAIMDSGSAIAFNPFMPGGGFGSLQMEGCPDVVCVPDPATFRTLPWAPGTGWVQSAVPPSAPSWANAEGEPTANIAAVMSATVTNMTHRPRPKIYYYNPTSATRPGPNNNPR